MQIVHYTYSKLIKLSLEFRVFSLYSDRSKFLKQMIIKNYDI